MAVEYNRCSPTSEDEARVSWALIVWVERAWCNQCCVCVCKCCAIRGRETEQHIYLGRVMKAWEVWQNCLVSHSVTPHPRTEQHRRRDSGRYGQSGKMFHSIPLLLEQGIGGD